jgi:hypothetical protein
MALSSKTRSKLPDSAFAYPAERKYPIQTPKQARNALARAAQKGTSGSYRHVAEKVRAKHGDKVATVGRKRGTTTKPGYRRHSKGR